MDDGKMKKRIALLALSVALSALLCGCINSQDKPQDSLKTNPPETASSGQEMQDSDVPIIEESDTVDIGTLLPETPAEDDASAPVSETAGDPDAPLIDENDTVEIGEMI